MEKYRIYKEDGGFEETFIMPESGEFETIEFSLEETLQEKIDKAIIIDSLYKKKITDLLIIPIQKVMCGDYETIPQDILDQRQALKDECNAKIIALGITDFTYRQSVPKLETTETFNK